VSGANVRAGKALFGLPTWRPLSTYGGAAGRTGYGLAQLADDRISYRWRSVDLSASNLQVTQTWDRLRPCGGGAVGGHNLRTVDALRLELLSDDAMMTVVRDTGFVPAWLLAYPFGAVAAEHYAFVSGRFAARETAGRVATRPIWFAGETVLAKGARWTFQADGHPDGFVEAGLLDVFQGTQLRFNFAFGSAQRYLDNTLRTELPGGGEHRTAQAGQRGFDLDFRFVQHKEGLGFLGELWTQLRATPFLWLPYPERPTDWQRESYFVQDATGDAELPVAFHQHDRAQVRLEEVIV